MSDSASSVAPVGPTRPHWSRDWRVGCCSLMITALIGFGLTWLLARHKLQGPCRTWVPVAGAAAGAAVGCLTWIICRRCQTRPIGSKGPSTVSHSAGPAATSTTPVPAAAGRPPTSGHGEPTASGGASSTATHSPDHSATSGTAIAATDTSSSRPKQAAEVQRWPETQPSSAEDLMTFIGAPVFNYASFDPNEFRGSKEFIGLIYSYFNNIKNETRSSMWIATPVGDKSRGYSHSYWRVTAVDAANSTVTAQWRDTTHVFAFNQPLVIQVFRP